MQWEKTDRKINTSELALELTLAQYKELEQELKLAYRNRTGTGLELNHKLDYH